MMNMQKTKKIRASVEKSEFDRVKRSESIAQKIIKDILSEDPERRTKGIENINEPAVLKLLAVKSPYEDVRATAVSKIGFTQDLVDIAIESDFEDSALGALERLSVLKQDELVFDYRDIALMSKFRRARMHSVNVINAIMSNGSDETVRKARESLLNIIKNSKYPDSVSHAIKYAYGYEAVAKLAVNAKNGYREELLSILEDMPSLLKEVMILTPDKNVMALAREKYAELSEREECLSKRLGVMLKE